MKKIFSKKAFTLVEVIIAMAITGLLIAAVMALFEPVNRIISGLDKNVYLDITTDKLSDYVYNCLNRSTTYNVGAYTTDQLDNQPSDTNSVAHRISVMIADMEDPSVETTRCLLIKADSDSGYRLYDFGIVSSVDDYLDKMDNYKKYALFSEEYYNECNYKFTFNTTDPEATDGQKWCKVGVTPYDKYGFQAIEERSHMFKLLNMSLTNVTPTSSATLKDTSYDNDTEIVVIYRIKDFTRS